MSFLNHIVDAENSGISVKCFSFLMAMPTGVAVS